MNDRQPSMLPIDQIHHFWDEVEQSLRARHHLKGDRPVRAILRYRNEIDNVGSIIYHRSPDDVADDILSGEYAMTDRKVG
jgi:hypothetical protein